MKFSKKFTNRVLSGSLIGAVNGLFGGGGGMIAVPTLTTVLRYQTKVAHATAIFIIAPVCLASAIIYIINGYFKASLIIPVSIGNVAGGALGALFLEILPQKAINLIFIFVMLATGIRMLF
ncbi:MAG: sulfite exporter TauE/SafE family protein [Clostridiales bacterium]|nr:sulfite exporter TauE/SafE family protein [Clostridiales bacterium]